MDVRPLLVALTALLLAGCEIYAVPNPVDCPGERQGVFDFGGTLDSDPVNDCFFAVPGNPAYQVNNPITFQAIVSFGAPAAAATGTAAVCPQQPHAMPREGRRTRTITPDVTELNVEYVNETGSVGACSCPSQEAAVAGGCICPTATPLQNCSCPVVITERIVGNLTPVASGGFSTFQGTQLVFVGPPPYLTRPDVCNCQEPCLYSYVLSATVVGSR